MINDFDQSHNLDLFSNCEGSALISVTSLAFFLTKLRSFTLSSYIDEYNLLNPNLTF